MMLPRRAPHEVYRVYSEAEFFDGAAGMELFTAATASGAGERRLRRLVGAAMLAGAVGAMGGAAVLASSRPTRGSGRRAGNGDAHAFARTGLGMRADAQLTHSPIADSTGVARTVSTGRARFVARARAGDLALVAGVSQRSRIDRRTGAEHAARGDHGEDERRDRTAITVDAASSSEPASSSVPASYSVPAPAAADGEPTQAAAPDGSPSVAAASPPQPAPSAGRAEFGFER
jgi:hypothetical protein